MLCHGGGCKVLTWTNLTVMCENFSIKVCHVRCRKKLSSSSTPAACSHQHFLWQKVLARNSAMQWQVIAKISQKKQQSMIFRIKEKEVGIRYVVVLLEEKRHNQLGTCLQIFSHFFVCVSNQIKLVVAFEFLPSVQLKID